MSKFLNQISGSATARLSEERIELAPDEVATVQRGKLKELRFAFGVAESLERSAHGITLT
jgi:hypothetical protein